MDCPELRIPLDCGAVAVLFVAMDKRACRCDDAHADMPHAFARALWLAYQDAELEHAARAARADDEGRAR